MFRKLFGYVYLFGLQIDILYVTPSMVVSTATKAREPARIGVFPTGGGGGTICILMEAVKVMSARETIEGRSQLSVETRQMRTLRVHMKGVLSWSVFSACRDCEIDFCRSLASLGSPAHFLTLFVHIAQQHILQRQFRLYIPFLGIARPQPQFPH